MPLNFFCHDSFNGEFEDLNKRFPDVAKAFESIKLIFNFQFHPTSPEQRIAPGKIHRITQNDLWVLWKLELAVKGIRSNQSPRIWFAIKGADIVFLCAKSHTDNYENNEIDRIAANRASDYF